MSQTPRKGPVGTRRPVPPKGRARLSGPLHANAIRILRAVGSVQPLKLTPRQISTISGVSMEYSQWRLHISMLRHQGLLKPKVYALTEKGYEEVGGKGQRLSGAELRELFFPHLGPQARVLLDKLVAVYPDSVHRGELNALLPDLAGVYVTAQLVKNGLAHRERDLVSATSIAVYGATKPPRLPAPRSASLKQPIADGNRNARVAVKNAESLPLESVE